MAHPKARFEKMGRTAAPLYGPKKVLLCGFSGRAQDQFLSVLKMAGLGSVDTVWADESRSGDLLGELVELPPGTGRGLSSGLPRAAIVGGITEGQLRSLMTVAKKTGMKQMLWAVLTPTSVTWPLERLLSELAAERSAMQK